MPILLLALLLASAQSVHAQPAASLAGPDTSETSAKAKGLPWIAHTSADAFFLASPSAAGGTQPYQISTYQAFTIQSLSFASFHAGWRYRETLAEGLSRPYRELFALKLMGTAEILRDHLFVSLGGSIPLFEASLAEEDTAALYRHLSGYNPLPAPNFVTPQGLQVGVFGRYRLGDWDLLAAAHYSQPTRFEPVKGYPFSPASQLGGALRAIHEGGRSRHRYDAKYSRFGREETLSAIPAHAEGMLYQARYAWLRTRGRTAWQLGAGAAVKWLDENRPLRLPAPLMPTDGNDNVQRAYAEAALTWTPRPTRLWRLWVLPKALLLPSARETGHETEAGAAYGMRLWEVHRLRASGSVLYGRFLGRDYLGFGLRAEFAFRHLGFQDLEAQGEGGGKLMDDLRKWYRGSLPASMDALRVARKALPKAPSSLESIRRIARSLCVSAASHGYPGLSETARKVEAARPEDVLPWLDRLLAELGKVQGTLGAGDAPAILVVEQDLQMARLLETILSGADREIILAGSAGEALACLEAQQITLIILDLTLPDTDGRNFLVLLRERSATAGVPVIILSGMGGPQPKSECFALGADAYFEKPIAPEVLKAAVSARLHKSVEHRREARQDALTGLPNRAAFLEAFNRGAALTARNRESASLALLDFDYLKRINDALGHVAGDAALRHAAQTFAAALRRSDLLARWGGDEFVLLLPGTAVAGARFALDKVLGALAAHPFRTREGTPVPLSFSAGLVSVRPGNPLETTLAEADRCLYLAKSGGRGRSVSENDGAVPATGKVLLAEDDEKVAGAIADSLRREGFEVTHCRDGASALEASLAGPFSLCIMDLKGAAIGGQGLLAEMRRRARGPRLPVLMITSLGTDQELVRGFALGADDYLVKPFSAYDLMARIHNLLRK